MKYKFPELWFLSGLMFGAVLKFQGIESWIMLGLGSYLLCLTAILEFSLAKKREKEGRLKDEIYSKSERENRYFLFRRRKRN